MTTPSGTFPSQPLVSVIIPTRNRARLLARSVRSVLAQSYPNLELIVVNDASTDDTLEVLAGFADPRLRVLTRERNTGAAAARNHGIRAARGELFAFQDDDDIWLLDKLALQVAALEAAGPGVGWCISGHFRYTPEGCAVFDRKAYEIGEDFARNGAPDNPVYGWIATPGWLVRRETLLGAGLFDERFRSWDDWELGFRLAQRAGRCFVDQPLFIQDQVQGGGMQRLSRARVDDMQLLIERHGAIWAGQPKLAARHALFLGRTLLFLGERPAARGWLARSLHHDRFRLRAWVLWLLTFTSARQVTAAQSLWSRLVALRG